MAHQNPRTGQAHVQDEIKSLKKVFDFFDKDQSGAISSSEMKSALIALGETVSDEEVATIVKMADKSGNGQIEFHEFVKVLQQQGRGYKEPRKADHYNDQHLKQAFQLFDADHDGFISKEEMKATVKHLSLEAELSDAVIDEMFRTADTNKDKLLSLAEYSAAVRGHRSH